MLEKGHLATETTIKAGYRYTLALLLLPPHPLLSFTLRLTMVPFTRFAWSIAPQLGQPLIARRSITHAVQLTLVLLVSMGIAHLLTTASMAAVIPVRE